MSHINLTFALSRRLFRTKLLILMLLMAAITACSPATPMTAVSEAPQVQAETPASQPFTTEIASTTTPLVSPTVMGDLKVTIVYDNTAIDPQLIPNWGFAAVVEYGDHTLLFDTGASGSILLDNMRQLGVDPRSIEAIILSHEHDDHTGGLQALLDTGIKPTVYVPSRFKNAFKRDVRTQTELVEVDDALEIMPGVRITGPIGTIVEQALVLETQDGAVMITGCAHPGIVKMVQEAQESVGSEIAVVMGGFHLLQSGNRQVESIIAELRQLGVQRILASHCTGDNAITLFRTEYRESYIEGGVGRTVSFAAN